MQRRLALLPIIALCVLTYGCAFYFQWQPILPELAEGQHPSTVIKNWYLSDQFTYMGITSNVKEGGEAYREPFTYTGSSIYPSGYYWFLGMTARVTGISPVAAWNLVGMIALLILMITIGLWGRWASGTRWAWALGPLPVLVGTLQWYSTGGWREEFGGVQAVLWPPFAILFNPGAEVVTLTLSVAAILVLLKSTNEDGCVSFKGACISGALLGVSANVHSYVTIFSAFILVATAVWSQIAAEISRRAIAIGIGSLITGILVATSGIMPVALGRLGIVIISLLVPLASVSRWRRRTLPNIVAMLVCAGIAAGPIAVRILIQATDKDSYFYFRQRLYEGKDLSLPPGAVFLQASPVLILALFCIVSLVRRSTEDDRTRSWLVVTLATLTGSVVLIFNRAWGFDQEPYRFFPYAILMLVTLCAPWLISSIRESFETSLRVIAAASLAVTAPTTWMFYKETANLRLDISTTEQATYKRIASELPKEGLTLLGSCLSHRIFKVTTGARVTEFAIGLGVPADFRPVEQVIVISREGILADNETLRRANVTSFVTMNYCRTPTVDQLVERFGPPVASTRLTNPRKCGLPDDATFHVFNVGKKPSMITPPPKDYLKPPVALFRPRPDGKSLELAGKPCSIGNYF